MNFIFNYQNRPPCHDLRDFEKIIFLFVNNINVKSEFAKQLKYLRIEAGLSQSQLAEIFNVSKQTISAWENGLQETDLNTLIKIANYFKVTTDFLLGIE